MKARVFRIVIEAEFDQEFDEGEVSTRVMQALQSPGLASPPRRRLARALSRHCAHLVLEVFDRRAST